MKKTIYIYYLCNKFDEKIAKFEVLFYPKYFLINNLNILNQEECEKLNITSLQDLEIYFANRCNEHYDLLMIMY